jgi:regulation of enolase protein 1 (concanavalin A-like superfamily)
MCKTALIVLGSLVFLGAAQPTPIFEDSFSGKLADGWTWVREDPKGWRVDEKGLHIRNQHGSLWGGGNDARNVLLRPLPPLPDDGGALAVDVTVRHKPQINAEQAGLVYHVDDENYVKLIYESLEKRELIVFAREHKGESMVIASVPVPNEAPRLRLVITHDGLRGQFLAEDNTWRQIGHCDFPADKAPSKDARVGLVCHGGPHEVERWATFNDFKIAAENEK